MTEFEFNRLTVGELKRFLSENDLPDDALVGKPPDLGDLEFIPFDSVAVIHVKRAEPTKSFQWVRYFMSSKKLARIPALVLKVR